MSRKYEYVYGGEDWSLQILDNNEISNIYKINFMQESGTLILWEETDRIIDNTVLSLTEDIVYEKINSVQKHLELLLQ